MHHWLMTLDSLIKQHPSWGMLFAFGIAFAESLPVVGTIIPGSVTMTAVGILIGRALVPAFETIFLASAGSFAGDCVGFWFGGYFKEELIKIWPFKKRGHWLTLGKDFFHKHGGKSIIIGRFVGAIRSCVPMIAGLLHMPWPRFIAAAVPSAILWAVLYLLPGILIGSISLALPPAQTGEFILIAFVVIVILWLAFWAIQYFFNQIMSVIDRLLQHTWERIMQMQSFGKLFKPITNLQNPNDHHQFSMLMTTIICFTLFVVLWFNVIFNTSLMHLNPPLFSFFQSLRTPFFNKVMVIITLLGQWQALMAEAALIVGLLLIKRQWRVALHFAGLMTITTVAIVFFKASHYEPRPSGFMMVAKSSAFPSGHTVAGIAFYGFLGFLSAQLIGRRWHWMGYTLATIISVLIGFSRLYLGAHWFWDVIGGFLLGLSIVLIVIINYRRYPIAPKFLQLAKRYWFLAMGLTIVIYGCIYQTKYYAPNVYRYTPTVPHHTMTLNQWQTSPFKYLPIYRNNRFGHPFQPFNVQWLGSRADIIDSLEKHGWQLMVAHSTIKSTLQQIMNKKTPYQHPILPWIYEHQPPTIFMVKPINPYIHLDLHLWNAHVSIKFSDKPLWLGTINYHEGKLFSFRDDAGLSYLNLNRQQWQIKTLRISHKKVIEVMRKLGWKGEIIVIAPTSL